LIFTNNKQPGVGWKLKHWNGLILVALLSVVAGPAAAAPKYFEDCVAPESTVYLRIESCTFSLKVDALDGDYDNAAKDCGRRLAVLLRDSACTGLQWRIAMMQGNFAAAVGYADTMIEAHIDQYRLFRGAAHYADGDLLKAAADFAGYTEVAPGDPYGWLWLYLAEKKLGKDAEANYYLGELAFIAGDPAREALFRSSVAAGRAEIEPTMSLPVYKSDDDLELAMANAALHGKGL
jgi:hypothetical protein